MSDVFISYPRTEKGAAEEIAKRLRSRGLTVWFDVSLAAGESFSDSIDAAARNAKAMLVCWSPAALKSRWVKAEALIGFDEDKLVCAHVVGPDGFRAPAPFNAVHTADLRRWLQSPSNNDPEWESVLQRIEALCRPEGKVGETPTTVAATQRRQLPEIGDASALSGPPRTLLLPEMYAPPTRDVATWSRWWWRARGAASGKRNHPPSNSQLAEEYEHRARQARTNALMRRSERLSQMCEKFVTYVHDNQPSALGLNAVLHDSERCSRRQLLREQSAHRALLREIRRGILEIKLGSETLSTSQEIMDVRTRSLILAYREGNVDRRWTPPPSRFWVDPTFPSVIPTEDVELAVLEGTRCIEVITDNLAVLHEVNRRTNRQLALKYGLVSEDDD